MDESEGDADPFEVAREILKRLTPEEHVEVVKAAEAAGISEEHMILEALAVLSDPEQGG